MEVLQADRRVATLYLLQELWGGHVTIGTDRGITCDTVSRWRVWGRRAIDVCTELLEFSVVKKEQARVVVEFGYGYGLGIIGRGHKIPELEKLKRKALKAQIHVLNKRGRQNAA